ncbi:hypothetical protein BDV96DRAFT_591734 [Lophiotrema nucula]|uniref:Siderophore biosynthesis n=1 Tax=Lophiotrema nucula TaxID=690887 RepID=A0A6A5YI50_9PLEO|nr:hypothetical protein BDV96DRAFT_591734 [Lophiotrema nucula]
MYTSTTFLALAFAATTFAKTDLAGCTSTTVGASIEYYVPGTGEVCSILDCGGGRAPPKTDVPGCAAYVGTATYEPSFLPGYNAASTTGGAASSVVSSVEAQSTVYETAPAASAASSAVAYPSTLASITSLIVTGTGSPSVAPSGGNNLTASATLSATGTGSVPESTGAANVLAAAGGLLGLAAGVVGLAVL